MKRKQNGTDTKDGLPITLCESLQKTIFRNDKIRFDLINLYEYIEKFALQEGCRINKNL